MDDKLIYIQNDDIQFDHFSRLKFLDISSFEQPKHLSYFKAKNKITWL